VDLPEIGSMKPTIFELIRPVFEEWIGNIPLIPSAIYGVRIYTEGSILQVRPCSSRCCPFRMASAERRCGPCWAVRRQWGHCGVQGMLSWHVGPASSSRLAVLLLARSNPANSRSQGASAQIGLGVELSDPKPKGNPFWWPCAGSCGQAGHAPGVRHHQCGPGGGGALAAGRVRPQRQAHQGGKS
jgi:hypothetical protein